MRLSDVEQFKGMSLSFKFVNEKNLDDLLNGDLYMSPLRVFIEQEEKEKVRGQGDKDEGSHVWGAWNVKLVSIETNEVIASGGTATITERSPRADQVPIFCFTRFTADDFEVYHIDNKKIVFGVSIPDEEKEKFIKNFGNKAVLLPSDFRQRIIDVVDQTDDYCIIGMAKYVDPSKGIIKQRYEDFEEGKVDLVLWKDDFFKYQRESRLAFSTIIADKPFKYSIGSIRNDCRVYDTISFFNEQKFEVYLEEN